MRETCDQIHLFLGDFEFTSAREILDSDFYDLFGGLKGLFMGESDVFGSFNFPFWRGSDKLRVMTLADFWQSRHDALDIDDHSFHCARGNCQFLLENIPGNGQSMSQQDFVGCAANTAEVNSCGSL